RRFRQHQPARLARPLLHEPAVAVLMSGNGFVGVSPMIKYLVLALGLLASLTAQAERLKDISSIQGVRSNQLIGYGLVVGLNGTGDQTTQTPFTLQTFNNMLTQFGI